MDTEEDLRKQLANLKYRHDLLRDTLNTIAKETVLHETYSGYIVLRSTAVAKLAQKALENDQ